MRYIWIIFGALLVAMLLVLPRLGREPAGRRPALPAGASRAERATAARADSLVAFGLAQRGTPYAWAGTSPRTGFDCSGFIRYTFAHFGVATPHSTALLIGVGRPVPRTEARPGDIVVFTGTDSASRTPGHAGIVVSRRGERPLRFVHASSGHREPFVKVSQVENSGYERRFLQVRRVLGPGTGVATRAREPAAPVAATPGPPPAPVAALPARAVAVAALAPVAPLPRVLPKRPGRPLAATRKVAAAPKKAAAAPKKATRRPAARPGAPRRAPAKRAARSTRRLSAKTAATKPKEPTRPRKAAR